VAWVSKAASASGSAYAPLPSDPDQTKALKIAFNGVVASALRNPKFSFTRLADLLGEEKYPLDVIIDLFPFDVFEAMYPAAQHAIQAQLEDSGRHTGASLGWPFDDLDPNVLFWSRNNAARLITALTESQRQSFNRLLLRSTLDRNSVDQIAAQLRQIVGLHPQWAQAVTNYYWRMVSDGMEPAIARRRASIYQEKLLDSRAWMIARTELMKAQNMGQLLGWQQGIALGNLAPDAQMKWVTALGHPNPPCAVCAKLEGKTVQVVGGEFWATTHLIRDNAPRFHACYTPPVHPNCRCRLVLVRAPRKRKYGDPAPFVDIPQPPSRRQYTVSRRTSAPGRRPLRSFR
jgi:hypothetical protein